MNINLEIISNLNTQLPDEYKLENNQISLQGELTKEELSNLVTQLLEQEGQSSEVQFDFIIGGSILRSSLGDHIINNDIRTEQTLDIEYMFAQKEPQLKNTSQTNDWIIKIMNHQNQIILGQSDGQMIVCNKRGKHQQKYETRMAKSFNSNEQYIVSTHYDGYILVHVLNESIETISCLKQDIYAESSAIQESNLVLGMQDGSVLLIDLNQYEEVQDPELNIPILQIQKNFKAHLQLITVIKWISNNVIITGSYDHSIIIFNIKKGTIVRQIQAKDSIINDLIYFEDKTILSAHEDGYLKLWNTQKDDNTPIKVYKSSYSQITSLDQKDGQILAGSFDGKVNIWDLRSDQPTYTLEGEGKILACSYVSDRIMFGGSTNKLYIYSQ
ncbi:hypothetical protein pb186bvf_014499 [Paramecium bursaria]